MNTAFEDNLRWMEQMCVDLERHPAAATRAIEEFRDSPQALDICWALLQSGRASQPAEFHILASAKHALLFKWDALSVEYRQQWIQWLEGSLHNRVSSGQPNFLINKFIEVYVSIRKRSWLLASADEKNMLMAFLGSCLDHTSMPFQFLGATLLLYLVEEFQKTTSADVGVAMSFYVQTKNDFQVNTLPTILSLCWKKTSLLTVTAAQTDSTIFTLCGILLKTISEIISWEYSSYDYVNQTLQEDLSSTIHKPPVDFGNILLQSTFVDKIFEIYKAARTAQQSGNSDVEGIILEVRNLITAMSCINGDIFPSDEGKTQFANYLFTQICMTTEPHINRRTLQLLTVECDDYEEGGVRAEEMALLLQTFQHLLTNFSLSIVVSMPYFTNVMSVMGQLSMVICQEIDVLTADVRVRMQRSDFRDIAEIGIDNTWRFDIFTQSLDVWTTIQDAFVLVYQSTMLEMSSLVNNGQFVSVEAQVQLQQTLTSMQQFRRWLMTISEELFPRTFDCILMVLVNDCLAAAEEMTGEELERIDERVMEHLLIGTASLGRLHAIASISLIGNRLQGFVQDYSSIYEQYNLLHSGVPLPPPPTITASANTSTGNALGTTLNSSNELLMESWSTKNLFCLENVRVCLLLLHFLLVDDYSMVDPDGAFHPQSKVMGALRSTAGSLNSNNGSSSSNGGETPQISSWILQSLQDDPAQMILLFDSFRLTASLLQLQVQMLSTPLSPSLSSSAMSHPSISPLLLTTIFRFFSSTTVRYLDPKSESYSDDTLRLFPFLVNNANSPGVVASLFFSSPEIPLIYDLLLHSYGVIVQRLPLETDLILASSRALVLMAEHVPSHRVYHLLSSRSEMMINLVAAYDSLVKSTLPRPYAMKIPVIASSVRHLLPVDATVGGLSVGCLPNGKSIMSRLSDEGMIMVTEALGRVILHSPDPQQHLLFRSICESLYNSLSTLQSLSSSGEIDGLVALTSVNLVLAAISGIIRCSAMLDVELDAIYQLSFTAWQWIAWHLNTRPSQLSYPPTKDSTASSLATIYTCGQVLRDFAEFQLGKLSSLTATGVGAKNDLRTQVVRGYYHALVLLLQSYGCHLQHFITGDIRILPMILTNNTNAILSTNTQQNSMSSHHFGSSSFFEPVTDIDTSQWEKHVHQMLDILNQVSEKEFFISESKVSGDSGREISYTAADMFAANNNIDAYLEDLGSVLCLGLEIVNPLLSLPILRVYPVLMQQYIAFIGYLCGGEVDCLARWLVMRGHQFPVPASGNNSHPLTAYPLGINMMSNDSNGGGGSGGSSSSTTGTNYLQNLLWQLYEAALQSHDPATARQALQALQNLLQQQFRLFGNLVAPTSSSVTRQTAEQMLLIQPYHRDVWSCLLHDMTRTILLSSFPSTAVSRSANNNCNNNNNSNMNNASNTNNRQLPADRIDSFSSAFFALVLFTNHIDHRLLSVTTAHATLTVDELRVLQLVVQNVLTNPEQSTIYFINNNNSSTLAAKSNLSWTPAMQTTVWTMLRALFTERNVSLTTLDKKNRMEFTKNFKDFLRQLRSLSSA